MAILNENEQNKNRLIKILAIIGPTATKKSYFSIKIAQKINGEIISADSMQVYRKMNIGTAKLTENEQAGVKHYLIDFVDLNKFFSVADFVNEARKCLKKILIRNKKPILVGGSGLYVNSFLNEINFHSEKFNKQLKNKLLFDLNKFGVDYLFNKLKKIDLEYANKIHPNNVRRIVRALERCLINKVKINELEKKSKPLTTKLSSLKIGLNFFNRQNLYNKINDRVDLMMKKGLLNEANYVLKNCNLNSTAKQAIGYKEFEPYFCGDVSLEQAVSNLKKNTRHLAKRQLTWFRKDEEIHWFYLDKLTESEIVEQILNLCKNFFETN